MRKLILTLMVLAVALTSNAQKVKGSDTVLPLAQKFAENYTGGSVTITGGGSGVGLAALIDQTTDIAMASRQIKFAEKSKLKKKGVVIDEVIIGYDALAVIVNKNNPVDGLTREQIEGIYTGTITNWKEVGGEDLEIVVYARETSSGTYEFFKSELLSKKNYKADVLSMPATGAVVQSVSQTKGAIGYVGLAYVDNSTKALKLSYDAGKTFVAPSFENAKNKSYPVVRPLFFYLEKGKNASFDKFVNYVLTPKAQELVKEVGYIPVK